MKKKKLLKFILVVLLLAAIGAGVYLCFFNPGYLLKEYEVSIICDGVEGANKNLTIKKGQTINFPDVEREGYDFDGWYDQDNNAWDEHSTVSQDTKITAKWTAKKYEITYVIDGTNYVQQESYDSTAQYLGTPYKEPTTTIEYVFTGWSPELEIVKGTKTYTAIFTPQTRLYTVSLTHNLTNIPNANPGTISGDGTKLEYLQGTTISATENLGYTFLGWYDGENLLTTSKSYNIENINKNINLIAKYELISINLQFFDVFDGNNSNLSQINVTNNIYTLQPAVRNGYNFVGWFTQPNGLGSKVESINTVQSITDEIYNYSLYAYYSLATYSISYELNGGSVSTANPTTFQITSANITLNNPTKEDYNFIGWSIDGSTPTTTFVIPTGSYGNKIIVANWEPLRVIVSINVDGIIIDSIEIDCGDNISTYSTNQSKYGMSGYTVNNWYSNSSLTILYNLSSEVREDKTIYGTWTYIINNSFYKYIDKFNYARSHASSTFNINSFDELVAWAEYVAFYDITSPIYFDLNYSFSTSVDSQLESAIHKCLFPLRNGNVAKGTKTNNTYSIYLCNSYRSLDAKYVCSPSKEQTLPQKNSAFVSFSSTRDSSFDNFKINNVQKTLANVETSSQLVFALEKGIRPVCTPGSTAESIYNKAKEVLREICDDSMTDVEKMKAIYDWLIINVQYDHKAAETIGENWQNYDSWYAEGVFNNKCAVCDGIAKSLLILARIENIPCIRVTGNNHAWNKVYINGKWYGIDATHGDIAANGSIEILTYRQFLFTDSFKQSLGFTSTEYLDIVANSALNFYDLYTITYNYESFDLCIDTLNEFELLVDYIKNYLHASNCTFEITISSNAITKTSLTNTAHSKGLSISSSIDFKDTCGNSGWTFFIS